MVIFFLKNDVFKIFKIYDFIIFICKYLSSKLSEKLLLKKNLFFRFFFNEYIEIICNKKISFLF